MNLFTYHCEARQSRRKFCHRGWSLIVRSYTVFSAFPSTFFYIEGRRTIDLFVLLLSRLIPPHLHFWTGRNKAEDNRAQKTARFLWFLCFPPALLFPEPSSIVSCVWSEEAAAAVRDSERAPRCVSQSACTNTTTAASAQNAMRWRAWLPCAEWTPQRTETGSRNPMDIRPAMEVARPYRPKPRVEEQAWAEGAHWAEVKGKRCQPGSLEAPLPWASPRVAPR